MKQNLAFSNPGTGEVFGQVAMSSDEEVARARRDMAAAAPVWAAKPIEERIRVLRKLQGVMVAQLDEISAVINRDTGKSRQEVVMEIFLTANRMHEYLKHAPRWLRPRRMPTGVLVFKRSYYEHVPFGAVAVLGPWNFPLLLMLMPVFTALLAGNTVLAKPSEVTAATGVLLESLVKQVPELAPFVRFLHGDARVGAALVASRPDMVFLTGSPETGRIVTREAAETMTPVICELGGKDAMIVLADADIEAAARWGVWGAMYNTGQACISVERVYVVERVYEQFLAAVLKEAAGLKSGYSDAKQNGYDVGSLTYEGQAHIVSEHIRDAVAKGATLRLGGVRNGLFVQPTVITDVDHSMKVMRDETFGPVMPIMKVSDEEEAIALANDSYLGLGAYVWSRSQEHALRVGRQLQVGTVVVNDTFANFGTPLVPFGGVKQSGTGRTHGEYDLLQFTNTRSFLVGRPPLTFDPVTVVRRPGHYRLFAAMTRALFASTWRERLRSVNDLAGDPGPATIVGLAAAAGAIVAGLAAFLSRQNRPRPR